jgi:hypothetical protein
MDLYVNIYKHFIHFMIIFINTDSAGLLLGTCMVKKFRKADKEARRVFSKKRPQVTESG